MTEKLWNQGNPPHMRLVEVEYGDKFQLARAVWGDPDKGVLPHWELNDGKVLVDYCLITKWRYID